MSVTVPTACKGCGTCCEEFEVIKIGENERQVPAHLTEPCKPAIIDHGEIANRQMKTVPRGPNDQRSRCIAYDPVAKLCTIYRNRPVVCQDFERGCYGCRTVLNMAAGMDRTRAQEVAMKLPSEFNSEPGKLMKWEFEKGHRRCFSAHRGKWSDWICYSCFAHAKRIAHVKHTKDCRSKGEDTVTMILKEITIPEAVTS